MTADLPVPDAPVMICGSARRDANGGGNTLTVDEVYRLDEVPDRFTQGVSLHASVGAWTDERMRELKGVLQRHPGSVPLSICLMFPDNAKVYLRASNRLSVAVSEALAKECAKLVDGIFVETPREAGLLPPPEARWRRRNGN